MLLREPLYERNLVIPSLMKLRWVRRPLRCSIGVIGIITTVSARAACAAVLHGTRIVHAYVLGRVASSSRRGVVPLAGLAALHKLKAIRLHVPRVVAS